MGTPERYAFGGFTLDVGERRLRDGERVIMLPPKAYDVLVALVRRAGELVTKHDLLDAVWHEAFVEEGILTVHVSTLRKALRDSAQPPRYIETVPRSGYRFVAPVSIAPSEAATVHLTNGRRERAQRREPGERSEPAKRRASETVGESEGRSPSDENALTDRARARVYELCGTGRAHLHAASMHEVPAAIGAFTAAIALDPLYAPAHAGLALAHCASAAMRVAAPAAAYRDAKTAALRALAMDETSADAQVALGTVLLFSEWDWAGAERSLRRALEVNPDHQQGCLIYGRLLDACGRRDEGLAIKLRALAADPRSPLVHVQIALSYWHRREYNAAIEWAGRALAIDPKHLLAREFLVGAYLQKGDHGRAMAEALTHAESFGVPPEALQPLKDAYERGGRAAVVRYGLEQSRRSNAPAFQLAVLSTEAGEPDAAFDYLERAIASRDPSLVDLAVGPQWDPLRRDPRFAACLQRMGLSPLHTC